MTQIRVKPTTRADERSPALTRADREFSPGISPESVPDESFFLSDRLDGIPPAALGGRAHRVLQNLVAQLNRLWQRVTEQLGLIDRRLGAATEGPSTATDNAVARWDGTSGTLLQDSTVKISDGDPTLLVLEGGNTSFAPKIMNYVEDQAGTDASLGVYEVLADAAGNAAGYVGGTTCFRMMAKAGSSHTSSNAETYVEFRTVPSGSATNGPVMVLGSDIDGHLCIGHSDTGSPLFLPERKLPDTNLHVFENNSDTDPTVLVEQDGTGDAALEFNLTGGQSYSLGIDNSDSDLFKLSASSTLGTTDLLEANSTAVVSMVPLRVDGGSGTASLRIFNTVNSWQFQVDNSVGTFALRDVTGAVSVLNVEAGAPSDAVRVASGGELVLQAGPKVFVGTGSPEGAVTAGVGSLFLRTDGGAGTTLYVKESGTGNTGWVGK